jgi:hypothetical protein
VVVNSLLAFNTFLTDSQTAGNRHIRISSKIAGTSFRSDYGKVRGTKSKEGRKSKMNLPIEQSTCTCEKTIKLPQN